MGTLDLPIMGTLDLPFKVGEQAESRSFVSGFRGAWFRCKIKDIVGEKSQTKCVLEYVDFPDEEIETILLYQKRPTNNRRSKQKKLEIMVRPPFPPIYHESQMPDVNTIPEVAVIFKGAWKVGDLVDWFADGCYWSGRVTKILKDEKVQIELFPPPMGEGDSYEVDCENLRPSLDWSPKHGWTVSTPTDSKNGHSSAWILNPVNREKTARSLVHSASKEGIVVQEKSPRSFSASKESNVVQEKSRIPFYASKERNVVQEKSPSSISASKDRNIVQEKSPSLLSASKERNVVQEKSSSSFSLSKERNVVQEKGGPSSFSASKERNVVQEKSTSSLVHSASKERIVVQGIPAASQSPSVSRASSPNKLDKIEKRPLAATTDKEMHTPGTEMDSDMANGKGTGKTSCSDNDSNSRVKSALNEIGGTTTGKNRCDDGGSSKKMRIDANIPLNLMCSDTIEAAIVDLEELVNRVKWMQGILQTGKPLSNIRSPWKFLEHRASSTTK